MSNQVSNLGEKGAATPPSSILALPMWPRDTVEDLTKYYGKHELGYDGLPTERWENSFLTTIATAYPMFYVGSVEPVRIHKICCNKQVAKSLNAILGDILKHYGSVEAVHQARMDLFGGCYCYRRRRGGHSLSTHAWGAAIDLDPERNQLGKKYDKTKGMMPEAVIKIFEKYGWTWGGLWKLPDAMHFQAAI